MASHLTSKLSFTTQPLPSAFSHPKPRHTPSTTIRMSSTTIEHVVLFKLKPQTPPTKLTTMLTNLNTLKSLNQVQHLTTGPIHHTTTTSPSLTFTHLLHSRYNSKSDLQSYASHPDHVNIVRNSVLPICDDLLAIDWLISPSINPIVVSPNSAMRIRLFKVKSGVEKEEVIEAVKEAKRRFKGIVQSSVGDNFSMERAKGFEIASLEVYPTLRDLEEAKKDVRVLEEERKKIGELVDGVIALDYVVPLI